MGPWYAECVVVDPHESEAAGVDAAGVYDDNGVDRSLIRWMLGLSPTERLEYVQGSIDLQASVRRPSDEPR